MKYILILSTFILVSLVQSQNLSIKDYSKKEIYIEMRDGVKLFTVIYQPKSEGEFPVLIKRTPYSVAPYGKGEMPSTIMHNPDLVSAGYIFVHQDMRGRWMSEGEFENTKPPYSFVDSYKTDEVTDSYDTYDWLVNNLTNFNGNIGQYGNSYLGYTSLVASVTGHKNLKAVLAMAPVTNFWFEDFNRYGLYGMNYMPVMDVFGVQKKKPTKTSWYNSMEKSYVLNEKHGIMANYYDFFLKRRALSDVSEVVSEENFFWENIINHPNYDAYRKERNWLQYLEKTQCQTMIVGGFNDEQNLYGIINSFKELAEKNPKSNVQLVLGPWSHGHPKRRDSMYYLGNIYYGSHLSKVYQEEIEFRYFEYHLKGKGNPPSFKAHVFDTGAKYWVDFDNNPFKKEEDKKTVDQVYFLHPSGKLNAELSEERRNYVSDPDHPVPFVEGEEFYIMAPKHYMTDDQRFVSKRPDVLTYVSDPLAEDMTVLGEIEAIINFATDHEDADIYVKIIDVFPEDRIPAKSDLPDVNMNGFQHLVRCGYIRGRYRNDWASPSPISPNKRENIRVPLLEVFHTFKKGHRVMVQVQSSMFPLFDLNPQKYIENIYNAVDSDFESATHSVYGNSSITLPLLGK